MSERNLDFDTVIDRKNTGSLKHDFREKRGKSDDLLAMWVADMDFKTSSCVEDVVLKRMQHGIYGYTEPMEHYFDVLLAWYKKRYDWIVDKDEVVLSPGVMFAMATVVNNFTKEGDSVLIQSPVYMHFRDIIRDNGRKIVENSLVIGDDFRYYIDYEDFEQKIVDNDVKLFLLCNPQNPGGRVWTEDELRRMGDICNRHNVIVVSDEIHADIVLYGRHNVYANLGEAYAQNSIVCTSPSKVFNLPGLQLANIVIANEDYRKSFKKGIDKTGYSQLNTFAIETGEAVYEHGEEWYQAMLSYIRANVEYVIDFIKKYIPQIRCMKQDATYLLWINLTELGLSSIEQKELIEKKAGLWLNDGRAFGPEGKDFWRINLACPRSIVEEAMDKLRKAVEE